MALAVVRQIFLFVRSRVSVSSPEMRVSYFYKTAIPISMLSSSLMMEG